VACRTGAGWRVETPAVPFQAADGLCGDAQVGTPRYGYEAVRLVDAMRAAGADSAWISLTRGATAWTAQDTF
jgi:hypothetical protein